MSELDEDAVSAIVRALYALGNGDASTHFGAIEGHAMATERAGERIAGSLDGIADALDRIADALQAGTP